MQLAACIFFAITTILIIVVSSAGVFMHDFRIRMDGMKVRSTRQARVSNIIKDTFYWPDMTVSMVTNITIQ